MIVNERMKRWGPGMCNCVKCGGGTRVNAEGFKRGFRGENGEANFVIKLCSRGENFQPSRKCWSASFLLFHLLIICTFPLKYINKYVRALPCSWDICLLGDIYLQLKSFLTTGIRAEKFNWEGRAVKPNGKWRRRWIAIRTASSS